MSHYKAQEFLRKQLMCNDDSIPFSFAFLLVHDSQDLPVSECTDEREAADVKCCLHSSLRFEKVSEVAYQRWYVNRQKR